MTRKHLHILLVAVLALLLAACSTGETETPISYQSSSVTEDTSTVQTIFYAQAPAELPAEDTVDLVILDEVTGLPYNPSRHAMQSLGNGLFGVIVNVTQNSVIKYYYERVSNGNVSAEINLNGGEIRYRMYAAAAQGETQDQIAAWSGSSANTTSAGRIDGYVLDSNSGMPLADILVTAGGLQTLTDGSGHFSLYPLPEGQHTLVAYSLSGAYKVFQQGAIVAANAATPAELQMQATSWVNVTFIVAAPESTVEGAVVRLAGNLALLGNTFSDLGAGISGDVTQMPVLTDNGSGYYSVKISLPTETEILYKYTLGDGFWNCEHDTDGTYFTRRLYLPAVSEPILIQDEISTWKTTSTADMWFSVTAPSTTPGTDTVSIQFQLANWMPGLPMYKIGDNQWVYPLISPQNFGGAITYRYCRNSQCSGSIKLGAEDSGVSRETTTQFSETTLINDEILSWTDFGDASVTITQPSEVSQRDEGFIAGVSLSSYYSPTWEKRFESSVSEIRGINANMVIISPSWTAAGPNLPLLFTTLPGSTQRWYRTAANIESIHDQGLQAGLFPQMRFSGTATEWWAAADTANENWWLAWFQQYHDFIIQYADLAEMTEAETLILGGDWVLPSLPIADNASTYSLPGSVESLWLDVIADVRQHYHGTIAWHIPVSMLEYAPLSVLAGVDQVYLQWDTPLSSASGSSVEQMSAQATVLMELYIQPFYEMINKPVIISLAYPSAVGADIYCIPTSSSDPACLDPTPLLAGPVASVNSEVDLQLQVDLYAAVMSSIEYQSWVAGVVSQGWYPPLQLQDASASVHGKPAQELLSLWFGQFLGN